MSVDQRRPLGVPQGLNLNVDPSQTSGLLVADGVRYDEIAALVSRFGRARLGLEFPTETGFTVPAESIPHLVNVTGTVNGFRQFYDQRVYTIAPEVLYNRDMKERAGSPLQALGWGKTGDVIDIDQGAILHRHNTGTGTAFQLAADFLQQNPTTSITYILKYSIEPVTAGTFLTSLTLGTGFAAAPVVLTPTRGSHETEFTANSSITDFTLTSTSGGAGDFYISGLSLKAKVAFGADRIEPRLNILHKGGDAKLYLNNHVEGGTDGILTGSAGFEDPDTRCKFVQYADDVYVIDESTRPKLFTRRPDEFQAYGSRVKYEVIPASIEFPTPASPRPFTLAIAGGPPYLPVGLYSFRVQFETAHQRKTGPSMPGSYNITQGDINDEILVTWGGILGDPNLADVTHANVYCQFTPPYENIEPTDYKFVKRLEINNPGDVSGDPTNSIRYTVTDFNTKAVAETLNLAAGHMPRLLDFKIVNDVGYGIPAYDTVFREQTKGSEQITWRNLRAGRLDAGQLKRWESTEIKERRFSPSWLLVSEPGEPYLMQRSFPIENDEIGVGLSTMGDTVFVHTTSGLHAFTDDPPTFKRIPSSVGTLTRDSIQEDERMIRFLGDDAVPRLFNGATIDEIALELLPLFDQQDYAGYYNPFDKGRVKAISSASGKRRYYLSLPTKAGGSSQISLKAGGADNTNVLAIADSSKGRSQWAVDRRSYAELSWLGRESQLIGVTPEGGFYILEQGYADLTQLATNDPTWAASMRWFGQQGFTTRWFRLTVEANTAGVDMLVTCQVDGDSELTQVFTVNTTKRERVDFGLPGWFKGLYMDVKLSGTTTSAGRQRVYDLKVEQEVLGVL